MSNKNTTNVVWGNTVRNVGPATKGLRVIGDANGTGSTLTVSVWGFVI